MIIQAGVLQEGLSPALYLCSSHKRTHNTHSQMNHNYCQSLSWLSPRQQSHFPHALMEQQEAEYDAILQHLSQMQQPSQLLYLEDDDNQKMSAEEKEEYEKQQQNDGNDNNALPSIVVPPCILEESEPLYNHKQDRLMPKMPIVNVNKDDK